jgi:hypothetical protein
VENGVEMMEGYRHPYTLCTKVQNDMDDSYRICNQKASRTI